MGLVNNFAVIGGIACAMVYAAARLLALLIVLRGTRPSQRAELVRAVAELFRHGRRTSEPGVALLRRQPRGRQSKTDDPVTPVPKDERS
jgi:hypothetical protein